MSNTALSRVRSKSMKNIFVYIVGSESFKLNDVAKVIRKRRKRELRTSVELNYFLTKATLILIKILFEVLKALGPSGVSI